MNDTEFSPLKLSEYYQEVSELQSGPLIFERKPTPLGKRVFSTWKNFFSEGSLWFNAGGGNGEMSDYLFQEFGIKFVVGDLYPRTSNAIKLDLSELPFSSRLFDGILLSDVIEHIPNTQKVFQELIRVLKLNGKMIVFSPNYKNICGILKKMVEALGFYQKNQFAPFQRWRPQYFEQYVTLREIKRTLNSFEMNILYGKTYWKLDGVCPFIYLLTDFILYNPVMTALRRFFDLIPGQTGLYFNLIAEKKIP